MDQNAARISYLGPPTSYTHQAALASYANALHELIAESHIQSVFKAVQDRRSTLGVVPFENSTHGPVLATLDLFANRAGNLPDVEIVNEVRLAIHHCLLGGLSGSPYAEQLKSQAEIVQGRAIQDGDLDTAEIRRRTSHITKIYTHPQAFGQCAEFLTTHCPAAERIDTSSTSSAAAMVRADRAAGVFTSAAIGSALAATGDLGILVHGCQDCKDNQTRFLVLQHSHASKLDRRSVHSLAQISFTSGESTEWKSMLSFTINHKVPGALAAVLSIFDEYTMNMTSINTRPTLQNPFEYIFFVEFQTKNGTFADRALKEVEKKTLTCRWLGCWAFAVSSSG